MKEKPSKANLPPRVENNQEKDHLQGYPPYPPDDDIYGKCQKDRNINPEDPSTIKDPFDNYGRGINNQKDFNDDLSGSDLDVPGSELDDELEIIGSEDEENNYYSLGGDDHTDLDEDNDESRLW
jgi:hypothetical protein